MKPLKLLDVLLILIGVALLSLAAFGSPSAVTQSPYAIESAGATLSALVNPDGTNATVYFNYGLTTGYGSVSATNSISSTNSAVETSVGISGLLARVPYHYRAVMIAGTNTVYGQDVVFTTVNYTYNYDGTGLVACDSTRPQDYEPGSVLGAALRQFKQQVLGAFQKSHSLDGALLPGIVTSNNIAPGAVSISMLDTNLQSSLLTVTNTVTSGTSSNLFTLGSPWTTNQAVDVYSWETDSKIVTNDFYTLASDSYPSVLVNANITFKFNRISGNVPQRSMTFPATIYIGPRVGWAQSTVISIPSGTTNSATTTIPISFLAAIRTNEAVRLVLGKPVSSFGDQPNQQTTVNALTVTGYE